MATNSQLVQINLLYFNLKILVMLIVLSVVMG